MQIALHELGITIDQRIGQFVDGTKEKKLSGSSSSSSISSSSSSSISSSSPTLSNETQDSDASSILKDLRCLNSILKRLNPEHIEEALIQLHGLHAKVYFDITKQEMTICALVYFHCPQFSTKNLSVLYFAITRTYVELACAGFRKALQEKSADEAEQMYMPVFKAYSFQSRYLACKKEASRTILQGMEPDKLQKTQITLAALDELVNYFKKKWSKHLDQLK
jgi:hypothetical protein